MEHKSVVIIGGGVIGLSVAYHLAKSGNSDVLLLEKNTLTSGTSWHAAGIVGPLRASQNLTTLAKYAVELFAHLEQDTGQATGYKQTGGLWLATEPARLHELRRIAAMGRLNNLNTEIISGADASLKLDCLHHEDVVGAMWVEEDGQVNPVDLCMAYAKGARKRGVEIRENTAVADVSINNDRVDAVVLHNGERIQCDRVINCAGLWAREMGLRCGVKIPLMAVEHIYVVTEAIPSLPKPCPIVRDLDNGIYLKEDAGKLVLGTFEQNAKLWNPNSVDSKAEFLTFDEDWTHAQPMIEAGIHRVPLLQKTGIQQFMNGPESFTPDTKQIMGEAPGLKGYFVAAGFNSIGIMSSAGVGKVMAQWLQDDLAPMDLWEVDIQRFNADDNDCGFLKQRIPESVHNQFSMHWPYKQARTGRDRKRSVWHQLLKNQGAVFGAPSGWERPLWFEKNPAERALQYSYGEQHWWLAVEQECTNLMANGALFELSPFTKIVVSGDNALPFLQRLCTKNLDIAIGNVVYTLMLNQRAGIEAELTVTRVSESSFYLVSAAANRTKDVAWLNQHSAGYDLTITDVTDDHAVIGLAGPASRACLAKVADVDFDNRAFNFSTSQTMFVGQSEITATRISYSGELGWELTIPIACANQVFTDIQAVAEKLNIRPAGVFALESCRLEKGYLHWGHDMGPEDTPAHVNLMFSVDGSKEFIGKESLENVVRNGVQYRLQQFQIEWQEAKLPRPLLLHDEPLFLNGRCVGKTTSGGLGFRSDTALCFATVESDQLDNTNLDTEFIVEIAGEGYPTRKINRPVYDAGNTRLKS